MEGEYGERTEKVVERGVDGRYHHNNPGGYREETWMGGQSANRQFLVPSTSTGAGYQSFGAKEQTNLATGSTACSGGHRIEIVAYQRWTDMRRRQAERSVPRYGIESIRGQPDD